MPIEGISDIPGLPRVGKIHLGIMVKNKNSEGYHPEAVDYFVFPEAIRKIIGDKPKILDIQFPVDDPKLFAPQFLKSYSSTQGLVCQGDGKNATQKFDKKTGAIADRNTQDWERKPIICNREKCPVYLAGDCKPTMNLYFCLLAVPGAGVWQLDTRSVNSMRNINNTVDIIRQIVGTVRWLPLQLSLEPRDVEPEGKKKMTIQVLKLSSPKSIIDLQNLVPPSRRIEAPKEPEKEDEQPEPGDDGVEIVDNRPAPVKPPATEEINFDEHHGEPPLVKGETSTRTGPPPWMAVKEEQIRELKDLYKMCAMHFKVEKNGRQVAWSSTDVIKALGCKNQWEIKETPWECWKIIISSREN